MQNELFWVQFTDQNLGYKRLKTDDISFTSWDKYKYIKTHCSNVQNAQEANSKTNSRHKYLKFHSVHRLKDLSPLCNELILREREKTRILLEPIEEQASETFRRTLQVLLLSTATGSCSSPNDMLKAFRSVLSYANAPQTQITYSAKCEDENNKGLRKRNVRPQRLKMLSRVDNALYR